MKKLFLLLIPVLIFNCVESKKQYADINQILIQKSIKWTKVASTSRNYEEAKKLLLPNMNTSTFSSNGAPLRAYDKE